MSIDMKACETCGLPVPPDWRQADTFGMRVYLLRMTSRLGLREAARKIGISPTTLSNMENNKHDPKISTVVKISEGYDVSMNEICGFLETPVKEIRR